MREYIYNKSRYSKWDGTQLLDSARPEDIFDNFAHHYLQYNDIAMALQMLLQQGIISMDGEQLTMGIRDLLHELQKLRQELLNKYSMDDLFKELREKLQHLTQEELKTLEKLKDKLDPRVFQQKELILKDLPQRLGDALEDLKNFKLSEETLRRQLQELLKRLQDIKDLEEFNEQYNFRGDQQLNMEEALELMEKFRMLEQLERALQSSRFDLRIEIQRIDPEQVREMLGEEAYRTLLTLQQFADILEDQGYLKKAQGRFELTAKAKRRIGQKALRDIFDSVNREYFGKHTVSVKGAGGPRTDDTKNYQFGDPLFLDLNTTLMNSLARGEVRPPLAMKPEDFEVYRTEYLTQSSTVLMLDTSWSMAWSDKFAAAKKVALALDSLIRTQFPRDTLHIVGFDSRAYEIKPQELAETTWAGGIYGTNMQHAFQVSRTILSRENGVNRQIVMISDGEPTSHFEKGRIFFQHPPCKKTLDETLKEVIRCTKQNITINVFMLEEYSFLRFFVDQIVRINKGRTFYTSPEKLGHYLLVDYVKGKMRRIH